MADVNRQERLSWRSTTQLIRTYTIAAVEKYKKAPFVAKLFIWMFAFANGALGSALLIAGPAATAQKLYDIAQELRKLPYGWLLLASIIAITSFPPLVGWSTTITVCGFAYGVQGWFVAAAGAIAGAAASFIVLRLVFTKRIRSWSKTNRKWTALENVIRARGLPLIILIRLSPFPPWVYANLLFASIETVSFFQFMIATFVYTPKLMIAVWIGSRLAMLSDGEQRDKMDTKTKIVNTLSIIVSIALAFAAGWVVWKLTEKEIRNTPGVSAEDDELAADALSDAADDLEAPLIRTLSPERYRDEDIESAGVALEDGVTPKHGPQSPPPRA
ncbi:Tlg2-vesicle protein [Tulasnella sp. 403]|nr:Tlg2-vesicle protein [Tulasnella sp. 403]